MRPFSQMWICESTISIASLPWTRWPYDSTTAAHKAAATARPQRFRTRGAAGYVLASRETRISDRLCANKRELNMKGTVAAWFLRAVSVMGLALLVGAGPAAAGAI